MKKSRFSKQSHLLDPDEILADSFSALSRNDILEGKMEKPLGRWSSIFFLLSIGAGLGYLLWRGASLQITSGNDFFAQSQENRFVSRSIFAPRGIILDRAGKPMVENIPLFELVFEREAFLNNIKHTKTDQRICKSVIRETGLPAGGSPDSIPVGAWGKTAASPNPDKNFEESRMIQSCGLFAQASEQEKLRDVIDVLKDILHVDEAALIEAGFPSGGDVSHLPSRIVVSRDLSLEVVAEISARLDLLPGIGIMESYRRQYRDPQAYAHLVGYTGKLTDEDIARHAEYQFEETIGKSGIEAYYDDLLRGARGNKIVEVDSKGVETHFRNTHDPEEGAVLKLTIDADLQRTAYDLLKHYIEGKKGASVVVLDVRTGAVRALVSYPGVNTNVLGVSMTVKEFNAVLNDPLKPLFNRAISGEFPSGSTIKPLFAAAALQEHIIDPSKKIYDEGFIEIPNPYKPGEVSVFKDWRKQGWVNFYDAIAVSANVYFYMIGGGYRDQKGLGIDRLKRYAEAFGLGSVLGIDIPGEKPGFFPDPASKRQTDPTNPLWRIGDTYNVSIGQGGVKTTPLQITAVTAAIANGGKLMRPYVLQSAIDGKGNEIAKTDPRVIRESMVDDMNLKEVRKGMRQTVTSGTARLLGTVPTTVAAKTGTAQASPSKPPHAWVTAFAPYDNPEIAITVMVEHAGEGSTVAVPITREILNWYFGLRGKMPASTDATSTAAALPDAQSTTTVSH